MKFIKTQIDGAYIIETSKVADERGSFINSWNKKEFHENNLEVNLTECNIAFNNKKGTIRGLHYQIPPYDGAKLVRCIKGKIFDVAVDLRKKSPTFKKVYSLILSEKNNKSLYIPPGFAHGFLTLNDENIICYSCTEYRSIGNEYGVAYNDPSLKIKWPRQKVIITKKDRLAKNISTLVADKLI